jgi:hypothetical protein
MDNLLIAGGLIVAFFGFVKKKKPRNSPLLSGRTGILKKPGPPIAPGEPASGQENLVEVTAQSGRTYWVQNLPQREKAAELLDRLWLMGDKLVAYCRDKGILTDFQDRYPNLEIKESWPESGKNVTR